jgi:type III pantothenate kinase
MSDGIFPMLVVDAGNSAIKVALVARAGARPRVLSSMPHREAARLRALCRTERPISVWASCVVPAVGDALRRAWPSLRLIGPETRLGFRCAVDRSTVGADRLANMAQAACAYGGRVLVADFGTAATFDLLDAAGCFAGGAIAPGLGMFAGALRQGTAQLPPAELRLPRTFAGRNTAEALRAGVAGGYAGLVHHVVANLAERGTRLVFTGGDARSVARLTGLEATIDPLWTLRGIAVIGGLSAREV